LHDQKEAFKNADFIYAKNWSSYDNYGKILINDDSWMINEDKMNLTNNAQFMHCLPVRRNVVVSDSVIDSNNSLIIQQADNRTYAAQIILKKLINNEK
jgi:N-succinyl-L-ornithine transcarbamylase